ncbi:MAG: DNA repair protein RadC [Chitinispirillaceae bacterium]|nr:DNA repair protein RadC [Chitinispirillaceae bacterium]
MIQKPTFATGHRERLRQRFQRAGRHSLSDHELIELLLTYAIPRRDTKSIAKLALKKFRSIRSLLNQPIDELQLINGIGPESALLIASVQACLQRSLEQKVRRARKISSPDMVADFVRAELANQMQECIMVLCLDGARRLVHHAIVAKGALQQVSFVPREILRPAIVANATAIILVHSHPSSDAVPSETDLQATHRLRDLAAELGIEMVDHLIVGPDGVFSLSTGKLL